MRLCQWVCILWLKPTVPDGSFANPWWCSPDADHLKIPAYWQSQIIQMPRLHIIKIISISISFPNRAFQESVGKPGNSQVHSNSQKLSKILTFAWKLKVYYWRQILAVVFLEVTDSLHFLRKNVYQNSQVWITIICLSLILSRKDDVYECTKWLVWLAPKRSIKYIYWGRSESIENFFAFYIAFPFPN